MLFQSFLYVFKTTAPDLKMIERWKAMKKLLEWKALDHIPRGYAHRLLWFRLKLYSTNMIICTILLTNICSPLGIFDDLSLFLYLGSSI